MKAQHTPGPWKINKENGLIYADREDDEIEVSPCICVFEDRGNASPVWVDREEEAQANAQFIVTACNSHYELLEALQRLQLEVIHFRDSGIGIPHLNTALEAAKSAIQKAKG